MIRLIAQYRIKDGSLDEVKTAIRKFVANLSLAEPDTLYHTYHLAGSLDFLHVMSFSDDLARQKHHNADYTREFVKSLYPHCEGEPKFTDVELIR